MMKVLTVVGARPQFIKAAALSCALKEEGLDEVLLHTGQHYDEDMSAVFFKELNLPEPAYHLGINSTTHGAMTGRMMEKIEEVILKEQPQMVIVFGDTNSTLAGALAATKLGVPVSHIEAGLRSGDMHMPEEINRVITDRISTLLFCPTTLAVRNLKKEGFRQFGASIIHSGDIMFDAAKLFAPMAVSDVKLPDRFVLFTIHMEALVSSPEALKKTVLAVIELNSKIPVIFPAHPRTKQHIEAVFPSLPFPVYKPFSYLEMLYALQRCACVITDSGGLQKEAYFFKKPCITLRSTTEWHELTKAGVNILAGNQPDSLSGIFDKLQRTKLNFSKPFYGSGNASTRIAEEMSRYLKEDKW